MVEITVAQEASLPDVFQAPHTEKKSEDDESGVIIAVSVVIALAAVAGLAALMWHLVTAKPSKWMASQTRIWLKPDASDVNFAEMNVKGNTPGKQLRFGPLGVVRPTSSTSKLLAASGHPSAAASEKAPLFGAHAGKLPRPPRRRRSSAHP